MPPSQALQEEEPAVEAVPAKQEVHTDEVTALIPTSAEAVPLTQDVHVPAWAGLHLPATQSTQASMEADIVLGFALPATQMLQSFAPLPE